MSVICLVIPGQNIALLALWIVVSIPMWPSCTDSNRSGPSNFETTMLWPLKLRSSSKESSSLWFRTRYGIVRPFETVWGIVGGWFNDYFVTISTRIWQAINYGAFQILHLRVRLGCGFEPFYASISYVQSLYNRVYMQVKTFTCEVI